MIATRVVRGPSSTTSEVRLQRHFASICTLRDCARDVSWVDFGRRNDAKDQTRAGSINKASETTAQFLVIRLWRSAHVVKNKVNRVVDFLVDFESQRTYKKAFS